MSPRPVELLLATWNGERFLPDLLDSLSSQSCCDFTILARDDGSTDGTRALLQQWGLSHPDRLVLLENEERHPDPHKESPGGSRGAALNFARLIEASSAPYVMFCDQDDRWMPEKVAVTLDRMRRAEERAGGETPILVHTDLRVVDARLNLLDESFWRYQKLHPGLAGRLGRTLVQNVVTGCTMMANRALLGRASPVPPEAVMHDWWLALVAAAFGQVLAVPEATIDYRQHGENTLGAKRWTASDWIGKAARLRDSAELHASLDRAREQARVFQSRFAQELDEPRRQALAAFASLDGMSFWKRRRVLLRHGLLKNGFIRNLGLLARV